MNNIEIYPWQSDLWQKLITSRDRLPHAMLLRGRLGIGKGDFAQHLAKSLLCNQPAGNGDACGICAGCAWFDLGNHPDFRMLSPDQDDTSSDEDGASNKKTAKKSLQISVAQVRDLSSFLELSSHHGEGLRLVIIQPAEALNQASANSLLKMLEEPPPGVIFILVAHHAERLLPTIISRCHVIDMPVPEMGVAVAWLEAKGLRDAEQHLSYFGGSPLLALTQAAQSDGVTNLWKYLLQGGKMDAFTAAPLFLSLGMELALTTIQKWVYDLLSYRLTGQLRYHLQYDSALQALAKGVDLKLLLDFQKLLGEYRKSANHPLSNEVQLENLLLQYTQIFSVRA